MHLRCATGAGVAIKGVFQWTSLRFPLAHLLMPLCCCAVRTGRTLRGVRVRAADHASRSRISDPLHAMLASEYLRWRDARCAAGRLIDAADFYRLAAGAAGALGEAVEIHVDGSGTCGTSGRKRERALRRLSCVACLREQTQSGVSGDHGDVT